MPHPDPAGAWTCMCDRYGNGHPHQVSKATWYRHLELATSDEEKRRIRAAQSNLDVRAIAVTLPAWNQLSGNPAASVPKCTLQEEVGGRKCHKPNDTQVCTLSFPSLILQSTSPHHPDIRTRTQAAKLMAMRITHLLAHLGLKPNPIHSDHTPHPPCCTPALLV
jgi:hypothetical protein